MIGIYKITNQVNGKVYIGQSVNIKHRWAEHRRRYENGKEILYQAMRKYGIENFIFEILEECKVEDLDVKEQYYIQKYNSYNNGYNMTIGGQLNKTDFNKINKIYKLWDEGCTINEICSKANISRSAAHNYLLGYKNYSQEESNRRGGKQAYLTQIKIIICLNT